MIKTRREFRVRAEWEVYRLDTARRMLWVVDPGRSAMSITNDAENVCRALYHACPGYRFFYRDIMGRWDELMHRDGEFLDFRSCPEATP